MNPEKMLQGLRDPDRWDQEKIDEKVAAMGEARPAGPRRRRLIIAGIGIAAVAAAAVVAVTVVQGTGGAPGGTNQQVAWKPLAAQTKVFLTAADGGAPAACKMASLDVTSAGGGGGTGSFRMPVVVTNHGEACSLPPSRVSLESNENGSAHTLGGLHTEGGATPVLATGGSVQLQATFPLGCDASNGASSSHVPTQLRVAGAAKQVQGAQLPASIAACGTTTFEVANTPSAEDSGSGPYSALTTAVTLPGTITAGQPLDYTVTVTNTSNTEFTFAECPSYIEEATVGGQHVEETYTLNCEQAKTLQPGQAVDFAMQLRLPNAKGLMKLAWLMDGGPSNATAGDVA